jgi:hypothetical protein
MTGHEGDLFFRAVAESVRRHVPYQHMLPAISSVTTCNAPGTKW